MKEIHIDVRGKPVGRTASRIAGILQNKESPAFRPNKIGVIRIIVTNTDKMIFTGKKLAQKKYYRHTGYIGHLKERTAHELFVKDSREILRHAVHGMLPKNRLLKERLKQLILFKGEARK